MSATIDTLPLAITAAETLANALGGDRVLACTEASDTKRSCIAAEQDRPLSAAERRQGLVGRAFDNYDPDRLCLACRAYWRVSLAAGDLRRAQALGLTRQPATA